MNATTAGVESKANGAARSMESMAGTVGDRIEKFSHDTGKRIGNFAAKVSDGTNEYVDTGRSYIKENPLQAVAYAGLAGLAVGCLLTLSARRK